MFEKAFCGMATCFVYYLNKQNIVWMLDADFTPPPPTCCAHEILRGCVYVCFLGEPWQPI